MAESRLKKLDSVGILIIALSAVIVSVWQVNLTREHNRLTVKPYLDTDFVLGERHILTIKNKGQGAAQITSFSLEAGGQKHKSWTSLFHAKEEKVFIGLSRTFEQGDIIGANEELVLCTLPEGRYDQVKIKVTIHYTSIYDEPDVFESTFTLGG